MASDLPSNGASYQVEAGAIVPVDRTIADFLDTGFSTWRRLAETGDAPAGFKVGYTCRRLVAELIAWFIRWTKPQSSFDLAEPIAGGGVANG